MDSLCRKPIFMDGRLGRKQEIMDSLSGSQIPARDHGQSERKPDMMDSLCRKRKLVDSFIPCVKGQSAELAVCFNCL